MYCSICYKPLTDPASMAVGMGPTCAARAKVKMKADSDDGMEFLPMQMNDENGVILERTEDGRIRTNVPWLVRDHSPTGFNWGYAGSGPADLALNILEAVLRQTGYKGAKMTIQWNDDTCFRAAYAMHQKFKFEFIAGIPGGGGRIPMDRIRAWIDRNIPGQRDLF